MPHVTVILLRSPSGTTESQWTQALEAFKLGFHCEIRWAGQGSGGDLFGVMKWISMND